MKIRRNKCYEFDQKNFIILKEIIEKLGNKNYKYIECRCKWIDLNECKHDDFIGSCSYSNGILKALDGDSYALDDLYVEYEENKKKNGEYQLTVWEQGEIGLKNILF